MKAVFNILLTKTGLYLAKRSCIVAKMNFFLAICYYLGRIWHGIDLFLI